MDRPERTEQMSKVFGAVPPLADAVARVVAACGREAVFGAVQQRVVDADVVGAALHARLLEVEHARLPVRADEARVVPGAVLGARAAAPEARLAVALLHCARPGGARRGVGAGHVAHAAGAPRARRALLAGVRGVGAVVAGDAGALRLLRGSGRTEREEATGDGHLAAGTEAAGLAEAANIAVEPHEARVAGAVCRRVAARAA